METKTAEVKVQDKLVGTATFVVYASVEEITSAIESDDLVKLVNRQLKLQAIGKVRANAQNDTPPRKISRVAKALRKNEITKDQASTMIAEILATA